MKYTVCISYYAVYSILYKVHSTAYYTIYNTSTLIIGTNTFSTVWCTIDYIIYTKNKDLIKTPMDLAHIDK